MRTNFPFRSSMTSTLQVVSKCIGCGFHGIVARTMFQRLTFKLPSATNSTVTTSLQPTTVARSLSSCAVTPVSSRAEQQKSRPLLRPAPPSLIQSRGRAEIYYQPSAWKRVNKHGIMRRIQTKGGIEVIWRRLLKGRHSLAPYERIPTLPTYDGKILPDHYLRYNQQLVNKELLRFFPKGIPQKKPSKRQKGR